jgi:hypothetical protein
MMASRLKGDGILLTDTEIRRAKPQSKPYQMADGRGLHLLVTPGGGKLEIASRALRNK